jgi:hypothetical protein
MGDFHGETTGVLENEYIQLEYLIQSPRIVRFSLKGEGKKNLFADLENAHVETPYGNFHFRGGHRLWHSPEAMPRTYLPDHEGATVQEIENGVRIDQPAEPWTHIAKSIEILLDPNQACVYLKHGLRNEGAWGVELAPWALTMFRPGGVGIFPQPAGNVDSAGLLPNRQITLWPYAQIDDPRLTLRDDFILIRADPKLPPFKFGYLNPHSWIGYWLDEIFFVKRFDRPAKTNSYPDGGCNIESYLNDEFIELETLGPMTKLEPGESVFHAEAWEIYTELDANLVPPQIQRIITA